MKPCSTLFVSSRFVRSTFFLALLTVASHPVQAGPPVTFTWRVQFGDTSDDRANALALNGIGSCYATGYTFGSLSGANQGQSDVFVSKVATDSTWLGVTQFGTPFADEGRSIAVSLITNVYVAGMTSGNLGGTHQGSKDLFLTHLTNIAIRTWTHQSGTPQDDEAFGVDTLNGTNVFVAGSTAGSLHSISHGQTDGITSRYNATGSAIWGLQVGSNNFDRCHAIVAHSPDIIYSVGRTDSMIGGEHLGGWDGFIIRQNDMGVVNWARQLGSGADDFTMAVATDGSGNAYVTGHTFGSMDGANAGQADIFLCKYSPSGTLVWTRQLGSPANDSSFAIAVDGFGDVTIAGSTHGTLDIANQGGEDAFLAQYDSNGNLLWKKQFGTSSHDRILGIAMDGARNIYIAGFTMGALVLNGHKGGEDAFIARLHPISRPSSPADLIATTISSSQINLTWVDTSASETEFRIERRLGLAGAWIPIATLIENTTSYSDTGLAPQTTYYYRVYASNGAGESDPSNTASATTLPTLPTAPTNLIATVVSSTSIDLTWTDNANNESGYRIERALTAAGTWTEITVTDPNVTTYSNTGLVPATTYFYRVRAYNAAGSSSYSNTASASVPDTPPSPPSNLAATAASSSLINITWADNSSNELGFHLERSMNGTSGWNQLASLNPNVTSHQDTGLTPNTTYYYRIRAYNNQGNSAYSTLASAITQVALPPAPTNLIADPGANANTINLAWTDNSTDEFQFSIERSSVSADGPFFLIGTSAMDTTNYSDTILAACTTYHYRIRALNHAGFSTYSNVDGAKTIGCTPSAPANLAAATIAADKIIISWTDTSSEEDGFKIQRSLAASGPWKTVATLPPGSTSFTNTGLSAAMTYFYRVHAFNTTGNSAWTPTASTKTQKAGTPGAPSNLVASAVSPTQVDLTWNDNANNETQFKVQRRLLGSTTWTPLTTAGANTANYSDTTVTGGVSYEYRVKAKNNTGASKSTNIASVTTPSATIASTPASFPIGSWNITKSDNDETIMCLKFDEVGAVTGHGSISVGDPPQSFTGEWQTANDSQILAFLVSANDPVMPVITAVLTAQPDDDGEITGELTTDTITRPVLGRRDPVPCHTEP